MEVQNIVIVNFISVCVIVWISIFYQKFFFFFDFIDSCNEFSIIYCLIIIFLVKKKEFCVVNVNKYVNVMVVL